jgi:hypothetical protein
MITKEHSRVLEPRTKDGGVGLRLTVPWCATEDDSTDGSACRAAGSRS